jgi:hypothetical protein
MTNAQIVVGRRIGNFEIVGLDATGKRVSVRCMCGSDHTIGLDALLAGLSQCPAFNHVATAMMKVVHVVIEHVAAALIVKEQRQ